MKTFSTSLLAIIFLHTITRSAGMCDKFITKWTLWSDPVPGLAAKLKVPVRENISSWTVQFQFNKSFQKLNFFNSAKSEDIAGNIFSVVNEEWSGKKKAGDDIKFAMLGDYQQDDEEPLQILYISLNNVILCGAEQPQKHN